MMNVRRSVFLLEDEPELAKLVQLHLERADFKVSAFSTAKGFVSAAKEQQPSLFLLDIMVPGGDGREVCSQIRDSEALAHTPVIFLTARASEADRLQGFGLGADDYITKPFSPREMVARVKAVMRRFEPPLRSKLKTGELEIDGAAMRLLVRGSPVPTTATEFRLLDYFATHPGRAFSRDQLLDAVWRDNLYVTPRSVDVYVRRLREKIEVNPEEPQYIQTVRGVGYRFEAPN